MPQTLLRPKPHLSYAALTKRYKAATTNRQQRYWQLIWLMAHPKKPLSVTQAASVTGFSERWARQLVHRYNTTKPAGYYDQRADNTGQKSWLTKRQQTALKKAILTQEPPGGGLWSSVTVADWIEEKTTKRPSAVTGWKYLKKMGFTLLVPRPRHTNAATAAEQSAFKKSSTVQFPRSNVVFQPEW